MHFLVLELLAVHPGHQQLGAGTALVTWGIQASDKLQVKAIAESTPAGRRVYEKYGMRADIEKMRFNVGGYSDKVKPKLIFMMREPASHWAASSTSLNLRSPTVAGFILGHDYEGVVVPLCVLRVELGMLSVAMVYFTCGIFS